MPVMSDFKEEEHRRERHPGRFRDKPVPASDPSIAEDLLDRARSEPPRRILFPSESLATDGGLIAITDVSGAMLDTGLESDYRVVGGIAVMLHVLRTGADIPIRSTGDADYDVCLLGFSRKESWSGRSSVGGTPRQRGIVENVRSTMSGQRP
jgi:hypothetical protein